MRARLTLASILLLGFVLGRLTTADFAWAQAGDAAAPAPSEPAGEAAPSEAAPSRGIAPAVEGQPRYLPAIEAELEAMGVAELRCEANDEERGACSFHATGAETDRELDVQLAYSDVTDTIYLYVNEFLSAPNDGEHTGPLLRRLMELNWTMLLGKFEWDPTDGEVRLAVVLNTDSNFDRRAFRSGVRALGALADRYYPELHRLETTGR
jgi:hypothetical protein